MKYKTKPCEIEAVQWEGHNIDEIIKFTNGLEKNYCPCRGLRACYIYINIRRLYEGKRRRLHHKGIAWGILSLQTRYISQKIRTVRIKGVEQNEKI